MRGNKINKCETTRNDFSRNKLQVTWKLVGNGSYSHLLNFATYFYFMGNRNFTEKKK